MLFQTTSAHEELRAKIRSFAEEEIKPLAFLMDQNNEFPEEAVKKLGKLGWMGIPYPKEYGGAGLDALSYAIAVEELARVDGGTGVILSAHVSLGSWPIFAYGTEEQKKKYLVPLAKGEKIGAFGLTETNAGSDAGGTETTALDKGITTSSTAARSSLPTPLRRTPMWFSPSPRRTSAPGASPLSSWRRAGRALSSATTMTRWVFAPPPRRS